MRLVWSDDGGVDCVHLTGCTAPALAGLRMLSETEVARRLPVYPTEIVRARGERRAPAAGTVVQSIAGRYVVDGDDVSFVPRFPIKS